MQRGARNRTFESIPPAKTRRRTASLRCDRPLRQVSVARIEAHQSYMIAILLVGIADVLPLGHAVATSGTLLMGVANRIAAMGGRRGSFGS